MRTTAPRYFQFAKFLDRHGLRGGYRIVKVAERLGGLDCVVRYSLGNGVALDVPLARRENRWTLRELVVYERPLIERLTPAVAQLPRPVTWIDCGADIGAVTALLAARSRSLGEAWVLEPNPRAFEFLAENVKRLPFKAVALNAAVADFTGRGALLASPTDPSSEHAQFLAPVADGDIEVVRLDDLSISRAGGLALKIDVEGGELDVLLGAAATLGGVPEFVVAFEAHRDVCARTGTDPSECLRFLHSLRTCAWLVAECPELTIDADRSYFDQVGGLRISNVLCWTQG